MKTCKVEGCNNKHYGKGYCAKHYQQIKRKGKIYKTYKEPNDIILYDDYAEIIILDNKSNEVGRVKIDLDDVDRVSQYKWHISHGYACCNENKIRLHRLIMDCPKDMVIDHINRNRLDNRKCNLRICTMQQNCMNQNKRSNNTSGYTGVLWDKAKNKWTARIKVNYKQIFLGYFNDLEEAIEVRKEAEIKYFGEYRNKS